MDDVWTNVSAGTRGMLEECMELAGDWVFRVDKDLIILHCHKSRYVTESILPEQVIGRSLTMFLPPAQQNELLASKNKTKRFTVRKASFVKEMNATFELSAVSIIGPEGFDGYRIAIRKIALPDEVQVWQDRSGIEGNDMEAVLRR